MKISRNLSLRFIILFSMIILFVFCLGNSLAQYFPRNWNYSFYFPFSSYSYLNNPVYGYGLYNTIFPYSNQYTGYYFGSLYNSYGLFQNSKPQKEKEKEPTSCGECNDIENLGGKDAWDVLSDKEQRVVSKLQMKIIDIGKTGDVAQFNYILNNLEVAEPEIGYTSYVTTLPLLLYDIYKAYDFTFVGFLFTCSPLKLVGGNKKCYSPQALSNANAEVYVRLTNKYCPLWDTTCWESKIAEELEVDKIYGFKKTILSGPFSWIFWTNTRVEVYQKLDDGSEHMLYDATHNFENNLPEFIYIDRDDVEIITLPPEPDPREGNFFGFERIGDIPVELIYQPGEVVPGEFGGNPVPGALVGYANTERPVYLDPNKPKLFYEFIDCAFGSTLDMYGNVGKGFIKTLNDVDVKYFRLTYFCKDLDTNTVSSPKFIEQIFYNTRKIKNGIAQEFMGPIYSHPVTGDPIEPTYIYANPYSTDPNTDWKYRGLLLRVNTRALDCSYGRYTFNLEPFDANMVSLLNQVDPNDNRCVLTMVIDNEPHKLIPEIENIIINNSSVGVCEIYKSGPGNLDVKVKYKVEDLNGHLRKFTLRADYGKNCCVYFPNTNHTMNTSYTRIGQNPYWFGGSGSATRSVKWERCAHSFRLYAWRRVTNGKIHIHHRVGTYHITILSGNSYKYPCTFSECWW